MCGAGKVKHSVLPKAKRKKVRDMFQTWNRQNEDARQCVDCAAIRPGPGHNVSHIYVITKDILLLCISIRFITMCVSGGDQSS